ncbi:MULTISPECIES: hypothetical protein [unclassified Bradyrhizobium]|uniref:hypothetical protein n=1 Tax=unclassified Bradyrhizobium TaxID=2631580 RepID=UPI00339AA918
MGRVAGVPANDNWASPIRLQSTCNSITERLQIICDRIIEIDIHAESKAKNPRYRSQVRDTTRAGKFGHCYSTYAAIPAAVETAMRYVLKNLGYTWDTISQGRNNVGRVWQHAETKKWHGMIGKTESTADTKVQAFDAVVSMHLGFESAAALNAHNSRVRSHNKALRAQTQRAVDEMLRGNFKVLDRLFGLN